MEKIYNIENILRKKGMRATAQRLLICGEIKSAGHIDIDNLYERLREKIPSLSLATVYKNIHALVKAEIVSEVSVEGRKNLFEMAINPHIHHICENCGHIDDLHIDTDEIKDQISDLSGKPVNGCKITVYGTCESCA
jgi:Fur family peroxide stress response transcriptional regulator